MSQRITQQELETYLWGAAVLLRGWPACRFWTSSKLR